MERRTRKKRANLIAQGGIMAVAILFANACILLRQIPLTVMWGDEGNSIYASAYGIFSLAWLISSYGLPIAMSGLLKPRLQQRQYKNAAKVMQTVFLYGTITSAVLGAGLFFGSSWLTEYVMQERLSALPLQILSVALIFTAWNGVLRGFFIGNGAGFPVVISVILEQVVTLAVGIPMARILEERGAKIGALLQNASFSQSFAVQGFCCGILAGTVIAFVPLLFIYLTSHSYYKKKNGKDSGRQREGLIQIISVFFICLLPIVIYGIFTKGNLFVEQIFFRQCMKDNLSSGAVAKQWGIYYGKYKIFTSIPVVLTIAMGSTLRDRVYSLARKRDTHHMQNIIQNVFQASMAVAIPLSVMVGVLSGLILDTFFPGQDTETAAVLLMAGFVTSVFFSAAYLLAEVLWGMKYHITILLCGISAFTIHVGILYVMLEMLHFDILGVLYADILYSFLLLFLIGSAVWRKCRLSLRVLRSTVSFVIASGAMTVALLLLNRLLAKALTGAVLLPALILTGFVVYFIVLLLLRGVREKTLYLIPGGKLICTLAKGARLL